MWIYKLEVANCHSQVEMREGVSVWIWLLQIMRFPCTKERPCHVAVSIPKGLCEFRAGTVLLMFCRRRRHWQLQSKLQSLFCFGMHFKMLTLCAVHNDLNYWCTNQSDSSCVYSHLLKLMEDIFWCCGDVKSMPVLVQCFHRSRINPCP